GLLACLAWGAWFQAVGSYAFAMVAVSLAGAIIAFLKFNFTPAKIFMGDTGSLMIGTVCSILSIQYIEMSHELPKESPLSFSAAPAITIAILILPLFDTMRVFFRRMLAGRSPFHPDRTHIHHMLLDCGFSHMQSTGILITVNLMFIILAVSLNFLGTLVLISLEVLIAVGLTFVLDGMVKRHKPVVKTD
ncbi:MAG: MraY family glycosyltransferase, partial [Bacteroidota bacterium]